MLAREQQRVQGHGAGSQEFGRLGQLDVGGNTPALGDTQWLFRLRQVLDAMSRDGFLCVVVAVFDNALIFWQASFSRGSAQTRRADSVSCQWTRIRQHPGLAGGMSQDADLWR